MSINIASESYGGGGTAGGLPLEDFRDLADNNFAMQWKERFQIMRVQQIPNITRWLRVLRYFHPRRLEDHWQDQFGMPLPKLADSEGLSVTIWNMCRPIIETYGSLLAGHKPLPFYLDVRPSDAKIKSERFRAQAQEDIFMMEMEHMKVPLHFIDFATSVSMFGIGWVGAWLDPRSRRMKIQAPSWPGDVLVQWGSNRYGHDEEGIESIILTENMPIDTAKRIWPDSSFNTVSPDLTFRPDTGTMQWVPSGQTQILKVWYRWANGSKQKIGFSEIAYAGREGGAETLTRKDDTGYPDIPWRYAARFMTPGEAPDRAAGVLDDLIGINTEYNERMSAFADLIMKFVYPKLKGKNYNTMTIPKVGPKQNVIPLGMNQDLQLIQDIIQGGQGYFDSFLGHTERYFQVGSGLSSLLLGALPPGETSGKALDYLIHASIGRLEVVRTPIQWAWLEIFQEICIPLLYKFGRYNVKNAYDGTPAVEDMKTIFDSFNGFVWTWPDVSPQTAADVLQSVLAQRDAGLMSDETAIERTHLVGSALDELEKVRQDWSDPVLHADKIALQKQLDMLDAQLAQSKAQFAANMAAPATQTQTTPGMGPGSAKPAGPNDAAVADAQNKAQAGNVPAKQTSDNARPGPLGRPPVGGPLPATQGPGKTPVQRGGTPIGAPVRQGTPANAAQGVRGGRK